MKITFRKILMVFLTSQTLAHFEDPLYLIAKLSFQILAIFSENIINLDPPKKLHNRTDPICRKWMQISKFVFSKYSGQPKSNIKIQIEIPRIDLL